MIGYAGLAVSCLVLGWSIEREIHFFRAYRELKRQRSKSRLRIAEGGIVLRRS